MSIDNQNPTLSLKLPISTILTILFTFLIVQLIQSSAPLLMPLFISSLLAVGLYPLVHWMESHRLPRWLAILILTLGLSVIMITIFVSLIPRMLDEFSTFLDNLPQLRTNILSYLAPNNPLRPLLEKNLDRKVLLPDNYNFSHIYTAGSLAWGSLSELFLILIFTVYLVMDGERVIKWSTAFFSLTRRAKIRLTFREVSEIIFSYVSGQFITSLFSFIFSFSVLTVLNVPGALLLAVLAALFDVLPFLGFILAVLPAMLFAFRVSHLTPLYVLLCYLAYHAIEVYLIVPLVYGHRLRLSGFTVLIATLTAGFLAGIEGAISILPVVASYPVIEKIWLRPYLGKNVLDEHHRMENPDKELKI